MRHCGTVLCHDREGHAHVTNHTRPTRARQIRLGAHDSLSRQTSYNSKKKKKDPLRLGRHKSDNDTCLEKIEMSKIKLIFKDKNINFGED